MIQIFFISIIFLVFSSLLVLLDFYRQKLSFLLRIRAMLEDDRKYQNIFFSIGIFIGLLLLFFPSYPGPIIIGDLIPSLAIICSAIYFKVSYSGKNKDRVSIYYTKNSACIRKLGISLLIVALLHFLFPGFVLL